VVNLSCHLYHRIFASSFSLCDQVEISQERALPQFLIHSSHPCSYQPIFSHIPSKYTCVIYSNTCCIRFLFYKNMVVMYVFLLEEAMHSYCCLCILIVSLCILIVVYLFLDAATLTEVFPCFFLICKANSRL